MSKYDKLRSFLRVSPSHLNDVCLSFRQIECIIGKSLPPAARKYRQWWGNNYSTHTQAHSWLTARFKVKALRNCSVTFQRLPRAIYWKRIQGTLSNRIKIGTNLDTHQSHGRRVVSIGANDITVKIGKIKTVKIQFSMIECCADVLSSATGFDRRWFSKKYPKDHSNTKCIVHVIGQIFVRAGLAIRDGKRYI